MDCADPNAHLPGPVDLQSGIQCCARVRLLCSHGTRPGEINPSSLQPEVGFYSHVVNLQLTKPQNRKRSMVWTEKRIKVLQEVLGGMRIIKYFAWEVCLVLNAFSRLLMLGQVPYMKRIAEYRNKEIRYVLRSSSRSEHRSHFTLKLPPHAPRCEGAQQRDRVLITGAILRRVDRYVCRDRSRARRGHPFLIACPLHPPPHSAAIPPYVGNHSVATILVKPKI